jgi:membrane-associated phospholipid phosphatase
MAFLTPPRLILSFGLYCLLAFGVVAFGVFQGRAILRFDEVQGERVYHFAQTHDGFRQFFEFVTDFGGGRPLDLLARGIVLVLVLRGQFRLALLFATAAILNREWNVVLKDLFSRLRPTYVDEALQVGGWSFPSGHAQSSMFIYGFLIYLGFLAFPRWKWWLGCGLMALIVLIGLSRMALGAHYFSDVLGGFLMAMAFLSLWIALVEYVRNAPVRSSELNA